MIQDITSLRTTPGLRRNAAVAAGLLLLLSLCAALFERDAGPRSAVLPVLVGWVIATELASAYVFFIEFADTRRMRLGAFGAAYLFAGVFAIPYLLTFPRVFSTTGLFGATGQSAVDLWAIWHLGFPAIIFGGILLRSQARFATARGARTAMWTAIGAVVAIAAAATLGVLAAGPHLPLLVDDNRFTAAATFGLLPLIVALDAAAVVAIVWQTRWSTTTALWLSIAVLCSAFDAIMGLSSDRYTFGWYIGKLFMVASSSVVLCAFMTDVSRLKRQIVETNGLLARYQLWAESARDSMLLMDGVTLEILDANQAAFEMFGYAREELIGANLSLLHGPDGAIHKRSLAEAFDTGVVFERRYWRKDGTAFPAEVFGRMLDTDERRFYVSTSRDISERFQAREEIAQALDHAIEASRFKSEFVATMSHEIRTPMNGIVGMTDLLLRTALAGDQREFALTVKESAQALLRIINDILDFSKIEAGKLDMESIEFDPRHVVLGVTKLLETTAAERGLELSAHVSPRVPALVRGDPTRLRQILVNLAGNALKFTESGCVSIEARVEADDGDSTTMRFAVSDTGIGISPEMETRLFQEFAQADGSIARRYGGTGLGLAISRRLVELMEGEIEAHNNPDGGATFSFSARLGHVDPKEDVPALELGAIAHLRVLIVDDDAVTRRTFGGYLRRWGLLTAEAANGAAALAELREAAAAGRPYDVVLLDFIMPQQDGMMLGAEIRACEDCGSPALVMITAFDALGRSDFAHDSGFAAFLTKPLDPSALYNALTAIGGTSNVLPLPVPTLESPADAPAQPGHTARLLLAEDNRVNRRVATLLLKELGYEADVAVDGSEAIAAAAAQPYDLILMDMQMPGVDGLAACRQIRLAERENGGHVVVIALTANALERDRRACLDAGMDDFLAKPLDLEALRDVLQRWLPAAALTA